MRCFEIHLKERFPFLGEDGKDPVLMAYLPYNMTEMKRSEQKRPCMFICPGGGYGMVSQREAEPIGLHFLPEGYNVFILTYSVDVHHFPAQLREVAAAMEVIHENQNQWNCDVDRMAILGFSAGGHLAGHYSNAYDCPEVREVFPESKGVKASILCYPVISADPQYYHRMSFVRLSGHDPITEEDKAKFSLDKLVTEKTPATFLWHTATDALVPVANSLLYAKALADHKVPFSLHIYPAGAHGLATVDAQTNGNVSPEAKQAYDWFASLMKWLEITL